jgi:hypothetical protein
MIDFLLLSVQRASFEQLMKREGFMDAAGQPMPGVDMDPTPGTPEYATGIPIQKPAAIVRAGPPQFVQGFSSNIRVSGQKALEQIAGLPQTDAQGNLLPLRDRTRLGQTFQVDGVEWDGEKGATGLSDGGVTFIDPESIASQQRVWQ